MRLPLIVLALIVAAAGCATTRVVHQWSNPELSSPPHFKKFLVIGISKQPSIRRSFEDEFVAKLKAAGVDAAPGYHFITEDGPVEEPRLRQAVEQAGADATLVSRFVRVEQRPQVSSAYYPPWPGFGYYRGYSYAWYGYYEPAVYQYDVYISETSLYDTATNRLVWSGTVETLPQSIDKDIRSYVQAVIDALLKRSLLPA